MNTCPSLWNKKRGLTAEGNKHWGLHLAWEREQGLGLTEVPFDNSLQRHGSFSVNTKPFIDMEVWSPFKKDAAQADRLAGQGSPALRGCGTYFLEWKLKRGLGAVPLPERSCGWKGQHMRLWTTPGSILPTLNYAFVIPPPLRSSGLIHSIK